MSYRKTPWPNNSCTRSRNEAWKSLKSKTFFFINTTVPLIFLFVLSFSSLNTSVILCEDLAPLQTGTPRWVWPISAFEPIISDLDRVKLVLLHVKPRHFMVKNKGVLVTDVMWSRPLIIDLTVEIGLAPHEVPAKVFIGVRLRFLEWNISCFKRVSAKELWSALRKLLEWEMGE